ncbi:hypothetical protein NC652_021047 [Populus alba x Populus x berolinensis]|nr:hypothetical protein NC652_021047 [Populus alba x Populus x berolinensis]
MDLEHGSGSSKHSESHPEVSDGSGTSDHEDTYPKLRVRVGSGDNLQRGPEKIDGTEGSKNSESNPEFIDGSVSSKQRELKLEFTATEGDLHMPFVKSGPSSSSPSSASSLSSSSSSLYDLFDVIAKESADPGACSDFESLNKAHEITQPASEDHENDTSIENSHKSKESECGSSDHTLTFPVSDATRESLVHNMSPTQSPSLQVMERPGGYDPFRIPSSIFERNKGPAPMDWSAASNESLFSIHVGNNSFSRDHVLLLGDLGLSGDIKQSGELVMFSPPPPKAMVATDNQSSDPALETYKQKGGANGISDDTIKDPAENQNKENKPNQAVSWKSPRTSNLSYESGDSVESFSFPIRKKKNAWPFCYFSSCSWALCYCKRPSCYFRWPSCRCSYCSWAFCYYWNCGRKGWCCHKYSVLANGMRNGSVKAGIEQRQQHLESPSAPGTTFLNTKAPCILHLGYVQESTALVIDYDWMTLEAAHA